MSDNRNNGNKETGAKTDGNPVSNASTIPRAWAIPLFFLAVLIVPQAASSYLKTASFADSRALIIFIPLFYASWRLWTQKGRCSIFSFSQIFAMGEKKMSMPHLIVWGVVLLLTLLIILGSLEEVLDSI